MYEIPSCPKVFYVQENEEIILIQLLHGSMVIEYKGDRGKPDAILSNLLENRMAITYILNDSPWNDRFKIYFTTELDYAAALLTMNS